MRYLSQISALFILLTAVPSYAQLLNRFSSNLFIIIMPREPICGNGVIESGEECEIKVGLAQENAKCIGCKIASTAPSKSEIFKLENTVSVLAPFDGNIEAVAVTNRDDYEKQYLIIVGEGNGQRGLAYKAAKEISSDPNYPDFKFDYCDLDSDPFKHLISLPLDTSDSNYLIAASIDKYYFQEFEDIIKANESEGCIIPRPIQPNLLHGEIQRKGEIRQDLRTSGGVLSNTEVSCNVTKIHDLKGFQFNSDGVKNIIGAVECSFEQPFPGKLVGLDIFSYNAEAGQFSHNFVAYPRSFAPDAEIKSLKVDLPVLEAGQEPRLNLFVVAIEYTLPPILVNCAKTGDKWSCLDSQEMTEAPLLTMHVDMQKLVSSEEPQKEEYVTVSQSGNISQETTQPTVYEEMGSVVSSEGTLATSFNPLKDQAQAMDAWFEPKAWNFYVSERTVLKGNRITSDESGQLKVIALESEVLNADSILNNVHDNETILHMNPRFPMKLLRDNFGGADLAVFFDVMDITNPDTPIKVGTRVVIYQNKNETPGIKLGEPKSDGKNISIPVFAKDVMEDPLNCETHLVDQNGNNFDSLIKKATCETVELSLQEETQPFESTNVETRSKAAKGVSVAKESVSVSRSAWPLQGTTCTRDGGDAQACASFQVSKSGSAAVVETPAPSADGETLSGQKMGWRISGKGCSLNPYEKEMSYGLFVLLGLLFSLIRFQTAKKHCGADGARTRDLLRDRQAF